MSHTKYYYVANLLGLVVVSIVGVGLLGSDPATNRETSNRTDRNSQSQSWSGPVAGVACRVWPKNNRKNHPAGIPIIVLCDTKNVGTNPGKVLFSAWEVVFSLLVLGPDGERCPLTSYGEREMMVGRAFATITRRLEANEIHRVAFHLNYIYDMTVLGEYQVSVSRHVWKDGERLRVTSNEITIEVTEAEPPAVPCIELMKEQE